MNLLKWYNLKDFILIILLVIVQTTLIILNWTGVLDKAWWLILMPVWIVGVFLVVVILCTIPLVVGVLAMLFWLGIYKTVTALPRLFHGDEVLRKGIS